MAQFVSVKFPGSSSHVVTSELIFRDITRKIATIMSSEENNEKVKKPHSSLLD